MRSGWQTAFLALVTSSQPITGLRMSALPAPEAKSRFVLATAAVDSKAELSQMHGASRF